VDLVGLVCGSGPHVDGAVQPDCDVVGRGPVEKIEVVVVDKGRSIEDFVRKLGDFALGEGFSRFKGIALERGIVCHDVFRNGSSELFVFEHIFGRFI